MTDKERLEEAKLMAEMLRVETRLPHDFPFDLVDWLVEQSERVQELEDELQELKKKLLTLTKENNQVNDELIDEFRQNKRYREALEKIKKEETVTTGLSEGQVAYTISGHIARQALEGEK